MASRATQVPDPVRAPQLDWSQWADGSWWRLTRVSDSCPDGDHVQPPRDALKAARMWARRNELLVEARLPEPGCDDVPWHIRFIQRSDTPTE